VADQQYTTSPFTRLSDRTPTGSTGSVSPTFAKASARMARVALKWRDLAERRRGHLMDLYESGRWKHYYSDTEFLDELRQAVAIAQRWARIALQSEELASPALVGLPKPKAAA
jgi:hypothetical protein